MVLHFFFFFLYTSFNLTLFSLSAVNFPWYVGEWRDQVLNQGRGSPCDLVNDQVQVAKAI
jgi:hypothetical protein